MRSAVAIAKGSATLLCLTATLLVVAACGSPTPRDFPALTLTNSPETTGEPGGPVRLLTCAAHKTARQPVILRRG